MQETSRKMELINGTVSESTRVSDVVVRIQL